MSKRVLPLIMLIVIFISACTAGVPKEFLTIPLLSEGDYQAWNVSVAVEQDGDKHIAWSECPLDRNQPCRVVYQRTNNGKIDVDLRFSNPTYTYYMANVAALDDGRAILAFYERVGTDCKARYAIIPDVVTTQPGVNPMIPGDGVISACGEKPVLAASGNTSYAVVYDEDDTYISAYVYRKLTPALDANAANVVAANPSWSEDKNYDLVAEVDSSGYLHAAWLFRQREVDAPSEPRYYGVKYANNNGVSGNLTPTQMSKGEAFIRDLDMAVQTPTTARMVFVDPSLPSQRIYLRTFTSGFIVSAQIDLNPTLEWSGVYPSIANLGTSTTNQVVVFSGLNNTLEYDEIFYKIVPGGGIPTQITTTPPGVVRNTEPSVVAFDTAFLAAWRTYQGICPRDARFTFFGNEPVTVFNSTGGCSTERTPKKMDLATKGNFVAGVWIDKENPAADALLIPYLSFNMDVEANNLPFISR